MEERQTLKAEIARLKAKRDAVADADIRAALTTAVDAAEVRLATLPEPLAAPVVAPTTTRTRAETDMIVRNAVVAARRGEGKKATEALEDAVAGAPEHAGALEALADDLAARHKHADARDMLARAHRASPKDARLELKYGEAVLRVAGAGTVDDQLRAALSDRPWLDAGDGVAGGGAALWLSALLPGLGHIVLGRTVQGFAILAAWVVCGFWTLFMGRDLGDLVGLVMGGRAQPNLLVLVPLTLMLAVWVGTVGSLSTAAKKSPANRKAPPVPPVDLPFD